MAASIDVVVPVHNNYALTCSCLEHLARQSTPHRVIAVDDGSSDATVEQLRRDWTEVTTIELGANHGYTRAVNEGVRRGDGEYVVLLNNDVQLRAGCLEALVAPLEQDAKIGSVAALMLAPGERTIDSFGITVDVTLAGFARLRGHPAAQASLGKPVLAGPEGSAGAYRRTAWEQVGGLDQTIRAYMEVLDLALRLRAAGWKTTGSPNAVGVHLGSSTYGHRSPAQRRLAGFSRGYLLRRYGVIRTRAAARALATEAIVVTADALFCHDVQAIAGRAEGWRAAARRERHPRPPSDAIDASISLRQSLALRRSALPATGSAGADA